MCATEHVHKQKIFFYVRVYFFSFVCIPLSNATKQKTSTFEWHVCVCHWATSPTKKSYTFNESKTDRQTVEISAWAIPHHTTNKWTSTSDKLKCVPLRDATNKTTSMFNKLRYVALSNATNKWTSTFNKLMCMPLSNTTTKGTSTSDKSYMYHRVTPPTK